MSNISLLRSMSNCEMVKKDKEIVNNRFVFSSKQSLSKSKSTNSDDQSTTSTESIQVLQVKSGHGIYSSQPRFYIPAIQSRFQYTKDRFCYKIKVSFPWIDSTVPPTMGTYYTTIQQFFELIFYSIQM